MAPSIKHKLDTHVRLVEQIKEFLPVKRVIIEVASFDTQKIVNPEVKGIEYQHGTLYGYELKEYLLEKWGRRCAYCSRENIPLEVEHIIPKSRGGSHRINNLTIACSKCNTKKGDCTAEEFGYSQIYQQAKKSLKSSAFMNNVRWKLIDQLNCKFTFGYITKYKRTTKD